MENRKRPIGVAIVCLWTLGLMLEVMARAWLLSMQRTSAEVWEFSLALPTAIVTGLYILALGAALFGLWRLRNWGRRLFLTLITVYYGLLLAGGASVWGPLVGASLSAPGQGVVTIVVLEAVLGLSFGWWYLNRKAVRGWFGVQSRATGSAMDKATMEEE